MTLGALFTQLRAAGLTLVARGDSLTLGGTGARPSPELLASLRDHRAALELVVPSAFPRAALPTGVRYITRLADLPAAAQEIARHECVGFDVETTGLDPILNRPRLVQVALPCGPTYVFDTAILGGLGPVAAALRGVEWVGHNLLFDLRFAAQHFDLRPPAAWCTLVASQLLDGGLTTHESGHHTLKGLAARWLGLDLPKDDQVSDWSGALAPRQIEYAARDAALVLVLREVLGGELRANRLEEAAALEFALLPVVCDMWITGVGFRPGHWADLIAHRKGVADLLRENLQTALRAGAGDLDEEVNPNSQRGVLAALRRKGLRIDRTAKEALAPFASDPDVTNLLRYRSVVSFLRGPGVALPEASSRYPDSRVRASLNPLAAPTGRFGCSRPNLQGLEKSRKRSAGEESVPEARACIVPASEHVFIDADYAAIELRVLAQITGDNRLRQIFRDGGDPHRAMAALVSRKPEHEVTKGERDRAKAVNFGFPFGMGEERFVEYALSSYGVSFTPGDARAFKLAWQRMFAGVVRWQQRIGRASPSEMRSQSGRRRRFESRHSGYCERLNMPVQGTAADGVKRAMVLLHERLRPYGARLVLCVHDELLVECPREHAVAVRELVERTMVEAMAYYVPDVPIVVEADIRTTWSARDVVEDAVLHSSQKARIEAPEVLARGVEA